MSSLQTDTAFINNVGPILDVDHCLIDVDWQKSLAVLAQC